MPFGGNGGLKEKKFERCGASSSIHPPAKDEEFFSIFYAKTLKKQKLPLPLLLLLRSQGTFLNTETVEDKKYKNVAQKKKKNS